MPHQYTHLNSRRPGRSTTGCANCKIRKVKCDEGRPCCLRCQGRHLECPGYPKNVLKWSSKHEIRLTKKVQRAPNLNIRPCDGRYRVLHAATSDASSETPNDRSDIPSSLAMNNVTSPTRFRAENTATPENSASAILAVATDDSSDTINAGVDRYSDGINYALETLTSDLGFALLNAPFRHAREPNLMVPQMTDRHPDSHEKLQCAAVDGAHDIDDYADSLLQDTQGVDFYGSESPSVESLDSPPLSLIRKHKAFSALTPLSSSLIHVPTLLVEYYFQNVCRDCSTFDSFANPFRSRISEMQHRSAPIHYVIQSLAASKLADDMPRMKIVGIEAQGKALQMLKEDFSAANSLHAMSDEVLFTLLLLGMTTSWHTREDLGLEYFHLARRIITAKARNSPIIAGSNLDFYCNAIKYWTMIASMVSEGIDYVDLPIADSFSTSITCSLPAAEKIMPHPWAGISPKSLQLFGQVLQLIRKTRCRSSNRPSSIYSRADVVAIANAITTAEKLEAECWSTSIPSVACLEDTGDPCTPPIHHVLTAKAYLMSALLHLYMMFPDVLETRIQASSSRNLELASEDHVSNPGVAHLMSQSHLWPQRSPEDHHNAWLKDIGHRIVECLESIDSKSSTRVVHPPLLLSVASVLTMDYDIDTMWHQTTDVSNIRIHQHRSFIISRLETMQAAMRFHAIDNILKVIREIWKRSDAGRQDTFWMDVMSELHCETIFG